MSVRLSVCQCQSSVCLSACTALHSISRYARSLRSRAPLRPPVGLLSVYLSNFRFLLRVLFDLPGSKPALGSLWQSWGVFGWPLGGVGACWGGLNILGRLGALLERLGAVLERLGAVLERLEGVLGRQIHAFRHHNFTPEYLKTI